MAPDSPVCYPQLFPASEPAVPLPVPLTNLQMFHPKVLSQLFVLCIIPSLHATFQPPITAAPDFLRRQQSDQNSTSCDSWNSALYSCSLATSNFFQLPFTSLLSCLCYTSSTWAGVNYDGYLDTCLSYLSTAEPSRYSSLGLTTGWLTTPCQENSPARTSDLGACFGWSSIEASCSVETPNIGDLPFSSQASCLCYSSSAYAPSIYDGEWSGCLSYFAAVSPEYTATQVDRTPCARVGNVRSGPTATATITSSSTSSSARPVTTTEPKPTGASGNGVAAWEGQVLARAAIVAIGLSIVLL